MKHPCTKDCPLRSATCHSTCPEWKKYEAWKAEDQKKKEAVYNYRNMMGAYRNAMTRRFRQQIMEV